MATKATERAHVYLAHGASGNAASIRNKDKDARVREILIDLASVPIQRSYLSFGTSAVSTSATRGA